MYSKSSIKYNIGDRPWKGDEFDCVLVDEKVFGSRDLPFDAAQYVGDFHEMIVDDVGEMVSREAVGLYDHGIALVLADVVRYVAVD